MTQASNENPNPISISYGNNRRWKHTGISRYEPEKKRTLYGHTAKTHEILCNLYLFGGGGGNAFEHVDTANKSNDGKCCTRSAIFKPSRNGWFTAQLIHHCKWFQLVKICEKLQCNGGLLNRRTPINRLSQTWWPLLGKPCPSSYVISSKINKLCTG